MRLPLGSNSTSGSGVAGVRDEEVPLVAGHVDEADDLAGVGQVALDGCRRHVGAVAAVERALRLVLSGQFLDEDTRPAEWPSPDIEATM